MFKKRTPNCPLSLTPKRLNGMKTGSNGLELSPLKFIFGSQVYSPSHMYRLVNASNSNLERFPHQTNLVNYSLLSEFQSPITFRSFSIKYVVEGVEKYTVNNRPFPVQREQYLLANAFCEGKVEIESTSLAKGICIDVSPDFLSAAVASHLRPDTATPDLALDTFFNTAGFLENMYNAPDTHLGRYLLQLGKKLAADPYTQHLFTHEFYFTLAEKIVADHQPIFKELNAVKAVKQVTKKDLYRRLQKGKEYMDHCFSAALTIGEVAEQATLSEYHFFRLFKSVYGITPHQYITRKNMEHAHHLLKNGYGPVSLIALKLGFADVFSFSKAFKKHFGFPPSRALQQI